MSAVCLLVATAGQVTAEPIDATAGGAEGPARIGSRRLLIDVSTMLGQEDRFARAGDEAPASLSIWYTMDGGSIWKLLGADFRTDAAVPFDAGREGTYGFYVVARNAYGRSGPDPVPGTSPQAWAIVDDSPPFLDIEPVLIAHREG